MVEHIFPNITLSHFIVEHDGNNEANASVGDNLFILLRSALSIRVSTKFNFYVTITRSFSTPRTSI